MARFHDLLRHDRQRRRHRRAEEVPDRGRRRRLQEASDRRRPLQIRQQQAGHRGRAGGLSRLLAARAERQDPGHAQRPRGDDARADGARPARPTSAYALDGPDAEGLRRRPGRADRARPSTPRSSGSSSPSSGTRNRRGTTSGCGWRSTTRSTASGINEAACLGFCPPAGVIVPRVMEFALQVEPLPYDPGEGQAAARRGRLSERPRCRRIRRRSRASRPSPTRW